MDAVWVVNLMLTLHQLFLSILCTIINVQAALVSIASTHFHYVILSLLPFRVPLQTNLPWRCGEPPSGYRRRKTIPEHFQFTMLPLLLFLLGLEVRAIIGMPQLTVGSISSPPDQGFALEYHDTIRTTEVSVHYADNFCELITLCLVTPPVFLLKGPQELWISIIVFCVQVITFYKTLE